jgi:hypothetical protein
MSYRKYECPKQPETPLDSVVTIIGVCAAVVTAAFIAFMAWCTL